MSLEGSTSTVKSQVSDDRDLPPPISFMDVCALVYIFASSFCYILMHCHLTTNQRHSRYLQLSPML